MNHTRIEIAPGAIATFQGNPTTEATEILQKVFEHFTSPLETFLHVNASELGPDARQDVNAAIAALVRDYLAPIRLNACPEHLQDALRRLVTQAAYEVRNAGKKVDPRGEYMPMQGSAKSTIINPCRR